MSLRDDLLAGIAEKADEFARAGCRSEEIRSLPAEAVTILRDMGFFWLKTPDELGGTPLPPLEFCDVVEELAYADASVAWAAMIGAGCNGLAGGWLPDATAVFARDEPLPVVAGQLSPRGTGVPADGGYIVSGRWSFSSGILHSSWLIGAFKPSSPDSPVVVFAVPKSQAEVIDNWHVAGLQGTGSMDFRLDEVFVPASLTYELGSPAVRGGDLFRLGMPAFVSNEVPPLCVGVARRALDDITEISRHTARFPGGPTVSERAVFHKELGRAEAKIRAARLLHRDAMAAAWESAVAGSAPPEEQQIAVTTASVFAVETCAEVACDLFRYGGGRVLSLSSPMQRYLRDLLAARQHLAVSEESYEAAGRFRIDSLKHDKSLFLFHKICRVHQYRFTPAVRAIAALSMAFTTAACAGSATVASSSASSAPAPSSAASSAAGRAPASRPSPVPSPTTVSQLADLLLTAGELPDGIRGSKPFTDPSPSAMQGMPSLGSAAACGQLVTGTLYFPNLDVPLASADETLERTVSEAVDPTGLGWMGAEYLYLYRPGQASQIMADIVRTARRCSAKPISQGGGGASVAYREYLSTLRGMGDEAVEVNVHSAVFHSPPSLSGLFSASNWIVIRSGNVLLLTDEMGNLSTLDKYLTAATSAAWNAYVKGT